jgi:hypothetical protein
VAIHELDDETRAIIQQLADKHRCTVEELFSAVLRPETKMGVNGDPVLGLFADEPDLLDQVVESAYEARKHPLRQPKK